MAIVRTSPRAAWPFAALLAAGLAAGCPAASDDAPVAAPGAPAAGTLVLGTYEVTARTVADGDTVRPRPGLSVRILGLDTEEVFHARADRAAAEADFAAYAAAKRGRSPVPVKYATPEGEAARAFVVDLVRGASRLRLEKDAARERTSDVFGRTLAHVFLLRPEGEVLLSEAVVREGHSPYFVKYGRSRRFDARLRAAEESARAARRGIWGTSGPPHYPDYPERLAWWQARASQIERWFAQPEAENRVTLGLPGESERLDRLVGRSVVVFGDVHELVEREGRRPWILDFSDGRFRAVVFSPTVFAALDRSAVTTRYVTVRGRLSVYDGRPQVVVDSPEQIAIE